MSCQAAARNACRRKRRPRGRTIGVRPLFFLADGRLGEPPLRAARGDGGHVRFRLAEHLRQLVAELAEREDIEPSEWYRRAVAERIERQTT